MQNFVYIIGDEKTKETAVVDAGWDVDKIFDIANKEKLKITKIILTHYHYDHVQKANELGDKTKAEIYFHKDDEQFLKSTISQKLKISGNLENSKNFQSKNKKIKLKNNDVIKVGSIKIKIIHTPGHTPGSICLLIENKLLTGDTLFVNSIGRTDLAGGDSAKLFESLQKLKKLKDDIEVYPGHDYGEIPYSTIANEKKNNPYFKCETKEQFLNYLKM